MPSLGCPAPGGRQAVLSICAFRAEGSAVSWDEPIFASLQRCHRTVTENDLEFFSLRNDAYPFLQPLPGHPGHLLRPGGCTPPRPRGGAFLNSVKEVTKVLTLTAIDWSGKP